MAIWCLATVYFVFPTIYCVRSLYGCILIQTLAMIATNLLCYHWLGTLFVLTQAGIGLAVFAGAMAAFMGRQLRAAYLSQLDREETLAVTVGKLDRLNHAKTEFVGRLSHELRTPMNGVLGLTALLQRSPLSEEQQRNMELLRGSGQHLAAFLDESLDLARLEAESVTLSKTLGDLRALVEE